MPKLFLGACHQQQILLEQSHAGAMSRAYPVRILGFFLVNMLVPRLCLCSFFGVLNWAEAWGGFG